MKKTKRRIVPIYSNGFMRRYEVQRKLLWFWVTEAWFYDEYHTQLYIDGGDPELYLATKQLWDPVREVEYKLALEREQLYGEGEEDD